MDDCLHIQKPQVDSNKKIAMQGSLAGVTLLTITAMAPTAPIWVAGLLVDHIAMLGEDHMLDANTVNVVLSKCPEFEATQQSGENLRMNVDKLKDELIAACLKPKQAFFQSDYKFNEASTRLRHYFMRSAKKAWQGQQLYLSEASIHDKDARKALEILVQALRDPFSPDPRPSANVVGDMFSLECQLRKRLDGLSHGDRDGTWSLVEQIAQVDLGSRSVGVDEILNRILAKEVVTDNAMCFMKLLKASLQVHSLRLHLASTYVICITGVRGAGKGTVAKNVFAVDAVCGSSDHDSTTDVQSYFIPVPSAAPIVRPIGDYSEDENSAQNSYGTIEHILILDLPGSDDVVAQSSLLKAEGFPVADLIIIVGQQERAATEATVEVVRSVVEGLGGIDEAVPGHRNVRSWIPESRHTDVLPVAISPEEAAKVCDAMLEDQPTGVKSASGPASGGVRQASSTSSHGVSTGSDAFSTASDAGSTVSDGSELTRQARVAMAKVVYMMTKADEHLANVARNREERASQAGRPPEPKNVDSLQNPISGKWKKPVDGAQARDLAESSWMQLREECKDFQVDRIAFVNCCNVLQPSDRWEGPNGGVVARAMRAEAMLGVAGVRKFLGTIVPPEVGAAIMSRRLPQFVVDEEEVQYEDDD